ncbi:hypothetical protein M408DRAFT_327295 [Serendipita vermifera MAFF 305830]|uniref:Nephrocystin 3-like N-terminal domain-containing protein n=1 Tax=Serendipita vermifera MAFF 305830 TaxID=933852 RepID=A0A0C2XSH1_SERVB|nr:hypothetical protein M408DRAFT_327295 [Serendipita vermifera MAFF 305830]
MSGTSTKQNDHVPHLEGQPGETSNIDENLLLERLNPIDDASYQDDRGCMEGTRKHIIDHIIEWATRSSSQETSPESSNVDGMLWVYGMPGIGKSAIAHSVCRLLHESKQLGGSFFCRRDDSARSESKSVLSTLIYRLAAAFGPYREQVVDALRNDPHLASGELFSSTLQSLKTHPLRTLVLVADALDECGEPATHRQLLGGLLKACQHNQWLKVIVISRPEHDIQSFFNANGIIGRDLGEDDHSRTDIRHFAKVRMQMVADEKHVSQDPEPWVGERRLGHIVNRTGGLFIFVETLSQYLMKFKNPKPHLDRLLEGPSEEASVELHKLYLAAIESRVDSEEAESRLISRLVIGVAPHRALCDKSIAALSGLKLDVVSSWVDDLGSLIYRDPTIKEGIRVRHISILEYLTGRFCPLDFRVDVKQADVELSLCSLQTMMKELRFNICGLESSYLANSEIDDLSERIQANVSDILHYSCLHWSSHLCSNTEPANKYVCELLDMFLRGEHLLYWLEILSVMGEVPAAVEALRRIIACSRKFDDGIVTLAKDVLRFVLAFITPISTSAPHIYISALPFTPSESSLWNTACKSFPKLMRVSEGQMTKWPNFADLWKGHTASITDIAYSPDGLNVVSGSYDNTLRIWDVTTGSPVGEPLKGHTDYVTSVAYSPDGRNIISGSCDYTIRIWDTATGTPIGEPLTGHLRAVVSVAYSPDSRSIVSSSDDRTIQIWDAATGAPVGNPLKGHARAVTCVAYSPDSLNIVSGSHDKTLRIWDAKTGAPVGEPLKGHTHIVSSVAYSPDGRNITSGSWDRMIRIWDAATGVIIGEPLQGHTKSIESVAYSPDGRNIVSGSWDNTIRMWDAATGTPFGEPLTGHIEDVTCVSYSPDGRNIVSGSLDKTIRIWDAATGKPIAEPVMEYTKDFTSVAYSPDGLNVVSGSLDKTLRIWDAKTGAPVSEPLKGHTNIVSSVAYSPDGRNIASGSNDRTIRIWNAATGTQVGEPLTGHTDDVESVAYSPDGLKILSKSFDKTVRIWDAVTGALIGKFLEQHTDRVSSVTYSPDSQCILSGSYDGTLQMWDAATRLPIGEPLNAHRQVTNVVYSPDGRNAISTSFGNMIIWDTATGTPVDEPLLEHTDGVKSVAYSPDGRNFVSASYDTIRIWDAATRTLIDGPLKGHTKNIISVAYSPDCRQIVSSSWDYTIRFWDARDMQNNDRAVSSGFLKHPLQNLEDILVDSSAPNAISRAIVNPKSMDSEGWVRCDDGILLWVPEDCRYGVTSQEIMIIPNEARKRCVRLDLSDFKYGSSWTDVYQGM